MPRCHVCSSPSHERVLRNEREDLELVRCRSCGFVYLSSWEQSLEQADSLYEYYASLTDADLERRHSAENEAQQRALLRELEDRAPGRALLDVGCGDGQLLMTATAEGWSAVGIDLCAPAVDLCLRRGQSASTTDFFDTSLDPERFDVILMSELIEHVPAPQRFLKRAEALLREGGILYLTTPNFGSLARRMLGADWSVIHPEHIGYFDRATLRAMLEKETNLTTLEIQANNLAPSLFVAWLRAHGKRTNASGAATAHKQSRQGLDQQLRKVIGRHSALRAVKDGANAVLSQTGLGDTLVAWARKPMPRA